MRQTAEKYIVRLPNGMRDRIRANAEAARRSMNAEIVHYIDQALEAQTEKGAVGTAIPPRPNHDNPEKGKSHE